MMDYDEYLLKQREWFKSMEGMLSDARRHMDEDELTDTTQKLLYAQTMAQIVIAETLLEIYNHMPSEQ